MIDEAHRQGLAERGFVLLPNYTSPALLEELRSTVDALYAREGEAAGSEFRREQDTDRLANLLDKGKVFQRVVGDPLMLEYVGAVITERFKLGSLNGRAPHPGSDWVQPLHCDVGLVKDERGYSVCNIIWMLDDFTPENGATRIIPGTHQLGKLPQEVLADPMGPHPDEALVTGPAGSVVIINAHAWHGGTANRSRGPRRCLHAFYTRWDKPQQQFQREMLSEATKAGLTPAMRELLAIDDEENARITKSDPLRSGFLK
ncbi:MAG: phytanoyl-CoA dioxygenase family protein [Acidobacteria bacterium]|nr:phytanoyl-CoA dioxygenase family protein [Acidobacteriota bacterium]